jgi:hypothetical protein
MTLQFIENALKGTGRLHAFLSGGGLRVVRIEKKGKLIGYGEHPHIELALSYANKDLKKQHQPYSKIYGRKRLHYLTGSSEPSSGLDRVILQGFTFDVWHNGAEFIVEIKGLRQAQTPDEVIQRVMKTGVSEQWDERGFVFETYRSSFPSGEPCATTRVLEYPSEKLKSSAWFYDFIKVGKASVFWTALDTAIAAKEELVQSKVA